MEDEKMNIPDSQQRGIAGEYYVAFILTRLGYDIGITIGRAKVFDMAVKSNSGKTITLQVKSNYNYNDWLTPHEFDYGPNSVVAFVRLGKDPTKRPELYFLPGAVANKMRTHKYPTHAPRINRTDIQAYAKDHGFNIIHDLLEQQLIT